MIKSIKAHLDTLEHAKGQSSLLFIISFIFSLTYCKLFLFTLGIFTLILSSYLWNAYNKTPFQILDHLTILFIGCSYINTSFINIIILYGLIYEYTINNQVYKTMRVAFSLSILLSLYKTYYYNFNYFLLLLLSVVIAVPTYFFRNYYYYKELTVFMPFENPHNYTSNDLTYLWHFTIMIILCITSLTANELLPINVLNLSTELTIVLIYMGFLSSTYYNLIKKLL